MLTEFGDNRNRTRSLPRYAVCRPADKVIRYVFELLRIISCRSVNEYIVVT